jgi:hypothetical protein
MKDRTIGKILMAIGVVCVIVLLVLIYFGSMVAK